MSGESGDYYVYLFLRSQDSAHGPKYSPYYVGKGSKNRAYCRYGRQCPAPKDRNFVVFVQEGLTEEDAFNLEKYCVALYGRIDNGTGILRNMTDGGDGISGYKHLPETIKKFRNAAKNRPSSWTGKKHSLQAKIKMSQSAKGRKLTEETRRKISDKHRGRKMSEEARQKLIEFRMGQKHSDETRQKISQNRKGKATGKNNSQWGKKGELSPNWGRVASEDTRRKISEAKKGKSTGPQTQEAINKRIASRAKYLYELIDKNGEVYVTDNIEAFARQYKLTASCLHRLLRKQIKSYKGWQIKIAATLK
jgi:hypothetical protein